MGVPLNPEGHPDENHPDEGPAGHLFRPAQGCIEGIAKKDLGQRDRNRRQQKEDADGLQGAVNPSQPFSHSKCQGMEDGRDGAVLGFVGHDVFSY